MKKSLTPAKQVQKEVFSLRCGVVGKTDLKATVYYKNSTRMACKKMLASTSLNALTAVVLDTETTGLDASRARLIQVGAVRLREGRIVDDRLVQLINPGIPIPPITIDIHGIDDASVKDAPSFASFYTDLNNYLGKDIIIGHNIGFDLAILQSECRKAGLLWREKPVLDTRLLAEICLPRFAGYSLDKLAAQFNITTPNRHDALADARITAELYLALLPLLRQREIRTFGAAEQACRQLTSVLENYQRIGWQEPVRVTTDDAENLKRIDAFPYQHRVSEIASSPPIFCHADAMVDEAVGLMAQRGISSIFVSPPQGLNAADVAIITERDVIRLLWEQGSACLAKSAGEIGNKPLETVPADAFVYRAIARMERKGIRHLGVTDQGGQVVGVVSARDLLQTRSSEALALGDETECANTIPELAMVWSRLPNVAQSLLAEKVSAREIAVVISEEISSLTARAAQLAEADMVREGLGASPVRYAVLVMGSAGRGESLLIPDQDNAILRAESEDEASAATWFHAHGKRMNTILDEIGIPFCQGNVMAGNPAWNGSPAIWDARFESWTGAVNPDDLLAVDIFYDFRCVSGDKELGDDLKARSLSLARSSNVLLKLLADALNSWSPPLGFLGRMSHENGFIDLKKGGLFPIVAAARCLALANGIEARSTAERISRLKAHKIGNESELTELDRIHSFLQLLVLRQQIADIKKGRPPSTRVEVASLSDNQRKDLRASLETLRIVPNMVHDLLVPS